MERSELEPHSEKTKSTSMRAGKKGFDFPESHHRKKKTKTLRGQGFIKAYHYPSKKTMQKMKDNIKGIFAAGQCCCWSYTK